MDIRLINLLLRGKWFISNKSIIANAIIVEKLLNRDWDSWKAEEKEEKAPLPIMYAAGKELAKDNSKENIPKDSIAIIPLKGSMVKYGTISTYGTEEIAGEMIAAGKHKNVSSIILDIDSGGGSVDAVPPMVDAIKKVRKEFGKPVIASCDLCCSAAYWVASECDMIIANNDLSAEFGSIGVLISFLDVLPVYEKMGYKYHEIYGEKSEDFKNKAFRLALKGEYDMIKEEELNPLEKNFQETMKKNRAGKINISIEGITYGKTFFADKSLEYGLIDAIGNIEFAIGKARELTLQKELQNFNFNN